MRISLLIERGELGEHIVLFFNNATRANPVNTYNVLIKLYCTDVLGFQTTGVINFVLFRNFPIRIKNFY